MFCVVRFTLAVYSKVTLLLLSLKLAAQLAPRACHAAFSSSPSVCQSPVTTCRWLPEKETANGNTVSPPH